MSAEQSTYPWYVDVAASRSLDLLTTQEAAELVGVTTTTISNWVRSGRLAPFGEPQPSSTNGRLGPRFRRFEVLAAAKGTRPSELCQIVGSRVHPHDLPATNVEPGDFYYPAFNLPAEYPAAAREAVDPPPALRCPCCSAELTFSLQAVVAETSSGVGLPTRDYGRATADDDRLKLAASFAENGLLGAWLEAAEAAGYKVENDPVGVFAGYLRKARLKRGFSRSIVQRYLEEFGAEQLQVYGKEKRGGLYGDVYMLVADGQVRAFVPAKFMHVAGDGSDHFNAADALAVMSSAPTERETWIRSRHGYVEGRGALYEALNERSRGAFAIP